MSFDFVRAWACGALLALGVLSEGCADDRASCETQACGPGLACDSATQLCRRLLPPTLVISSPDGGVVGPGNITLAGTATADDGNPVSVSYQIGDAGFRSIVVVGNAFNAAISAPPAGADGVAFPIRVQAVDDLSNVTTVTVTATVDNVAPVPSIVPGDLTLGAPLTAKMVFSEPVLPIGAPMSLTPDAGPGFWSDAGEYVYTGLAHDTAYVASFSPGAVQDRVGLRNLDGGTARFWTVPATAAAGLQDINPVGTDLIQDFESASSEDGVVTLVIKHTASSASYFWSVFDTHTGSLVLESNVSDSAATYFQATGQTSIRPDGTTLRVSGYFKGTLLGTSSSFWDANGAKNSDSNAAAVIPTPWACAELGPTDAGEVGEILGSGTGPYTYFRPPNAALPIAFQPQFLTVLSPNYWEVYSTSGSTLTRQTFSANCNAGTVVLGTDTPVTSLGNANNLSMAVTHAGRTLIVYDKEGAQRTEACFSCFATDGGTPNCSQMGEQVALGTKLAVASMHDGGNVIGAQVNNAGHIEIVQRDLGPSCTGAWTLITTVPSSNNPTKIQPQMFGNSPGVFFLDSAGLHLYVVP